MTDMLCLLSLVGDAAESARVSVKGAAEQVTFGIGAAYRFAVDP
jgi:hypothetical protein